MSYRLLYDHTSKKLQTAKRALTRLADIFIKPFFEEIRLNACFVVNLYLIGNYRIRYNNSLLTSLFHADFSFVSKQSFESDSQKLKPIGPIKKPSRSYFQISVSMAIFSAVYTHSENRIIR